MSTSICAIRGDDVTINIVFRDADGNLLNITGYTVFFTVKKILAADDADALISKSTTTHDNPVSGATHITLDQTDTDMLEGDYFYDFQTKDASNKIASTTRGTFTVTRDVTVRTS